MRMTREERVAQREERKAQHTLYRQMNPDERSAARMAMAEKSRAVHLAARNARMAERKAMRESTMEEVRRRRSLNARP